MGQYLVNILAEKGDRVYVTSRSYRQSSFNVEYIQGNAKEDDFLFPLLERQWDAIIDFMVYSTPDFSQRAPLILAATKQYIFLSSARVYAGSSERIREDSARLLDTSDDNEFLATDEYSLAKARQENFLYASNNKNWTIIRPYITYGDKRLQLGVLEKEGWLYRALKGRTIVFSKDMAVKLTTMTYGLDVALSIAALIGVPRAFGETYHVTDTNSVSWEKVLEVYLHVLEKHLGKRPKVIFLDLKDFYHCKPASYQIRFDRLFDRMFDCSKISDLVNVSSFESLEKGLTRCLDNFLENPDFLAIDWRAEAVKDRYSGEMARLSEPKTLKQKVKYLFYRFIKD